MKVSTFVRGLIGSDCSVVLREIDPVKAHLLAVSNLGIVYRILKNGAEAFAPMTSVLAIEKLVDDPEGGGEPAESEEAAA